MKLIVMSFSDDESEVVDNIVHYLSEKHRITSTEVGFVQEVMLFDPISRIVTDKSGHACALTAKEFDLLYFLFTNKGQAFTNAQLYGHIWGDDTDFNPRSLSSFICRLRQKFEPNPKRPKYILTVRGFGYKFTDRELWD